ncbi:MAG: hypothetical protein KDI09_21560, partial [Halioglobus sp.]|nr:hypothetical protein [Halioglobus sp.]
MSGSGRQFAIIAGSGFATFGADAPGEIVSTRFGAPSSIVKQLRFADHSVHLIARHGEKHD